LCPATIGAPGAGHTIDWQRLKVLKVSGLLNVRGRIAQRDEIAGGKPAADKEEGDGWEQVTEPETPGRGGSGQEGQRDASKQ
jgi:hypothetical protein